MAGAGTLEGSHGDTGAFVLMASKLTTLPRAWRSSPAEIDSIQMVQSFANIAHGFEQGQGYGGAVEETPDTLRVVGVLSGRSGAPRCGHARLAFPDRFG